jgi:hypothetical protein
MSNIEIAKRTKTRFILLILLVSAFRYFLFDIRYFLTKSERNNSTSKKGKPQKRQIYSFNVQDIEGIRKNVIQNNERSDVGV